MYEIYHSKILGLDTDQVSEGGITIQPIIFHLSEDQTRNELYYPDKLLESKSYRIKYSVMFPETMPNEWCVAFQLMQFSGLNNVTNPTLQLNVKGDNCYWQHKTTKQGPGAVFYQSPYIPGEYIHWAIDIDICRQDCNSAQIVLFKNGVEVSQITGQTVVDVSQDVAIKYGLYAKLWPDKRYRISHVSKIQVNQV
ncbi:MAG: polysaccharide lyase [Gammaproteobacteria bacterium]|nr:polysaccharide lyase [Gammaproteobacteria bacterium]